MFLFCIVFISVFCLQKVQYLSETFSCTSNIIRCINTGCHFNLSPRLHDTYDGVAPTLRPVAWKQLMTTETFFPYAYNPASPYSPLGTPLPPYSPLGSPSVLTKKHMNRPLVDTPRLDLKRLNMPFMNNQLTATPFRNAPQRSSRRLNTRHPITHQAPVRYTGSVRQSVLQNNQFSGPRGQLGVRPPNRYQARNQNELTTEELLFFLFLQQAT